MKKYKNILIALSLLSFAACGSSGGGHDSSNSTTKVNGPKNINPMIETGGVSKSNGVNDVITLTKDNYPTTKDKDGKVDATYYAGEVATGQDSIIINNGTITSNGISVENEDGTGTYDRGIGMLVEDGGKAINNGKITGRLAIGMESTGKKSCVINRNKITGLSSKENYKKTEENGILYVTDRENSIGMMEKNGASAINDKSGEILGRFSIGMESKYGEIKNYGKIKIEAPNYLKTHLENNILKKDFELDYYGMYATKGGYSGDKSIATNQGNIEITGIKGFGIGMYAYFESELINGNEGIIDGENLSIGMTGERESKLENDGTIILIGKNTDEEGPRMGILVDGTSEGINNGNINVNISSDKKLIDADDKVGIGMTLYTDKNISSNFIINKKNITLKDNSIGIAIVNDTPLSYNDLKGINNGDIYLNGHDSIGMYASGLGAKLENDGIIHLSGASLDGNGDIDAIADPTQNASGVNEFGKDNHGNIAMKIENGATMVNKGKIIFEGK